MHTVKNVNGSANISMPYSLGNMLAVSALIREHKRFPFAEGMIYVAKTTVSGLVESQDVCYLPIESRLHVPQRLKKGRQSE